MFTAFAAGIGNAEVFVLALVADNADRLLFANQFANLATRTFICAAAFIACRAAERCHRRKEDDG